MAIPRRVLITRHRAAPLDALLQARGLEPAHVPLSALTATGHPPPEPPPTLALVTSASAPRLAPGVGAALSAARVVAVGQKTAAALRAVGIEPVAVGEQGGAAATALLRERIRPGDRLGYVGAARPSAPLLEALSALPAPVVRWTVYDNIVPDGSAQRLARVEAAVVTLTSPSAARRYVALGGDAEVPAAVIGQTTALAAAEAGLRVAAVAAAPSMAALADAAAWACAQEPR